MTRSLRYPLLLCLALLLMALAACAKTSQPPLPVGSLKLGVAYFSQPEEPSDMLAGYTVENLPRLEEKYLNELDALLSSVLAAESKTASTAATAPPAAPPR
ncbi:hypothetical protein LJC15_05545 [Desulfovibrio sp. OttesenSCG-928-G11]|nr:hypothetical protein [Desulfovibrio sp. OttesenSCG-928-G11]